LKNGMQAKLIQTNDGFSLHNLSEVRFFLEKLNLADDVFIISDDVWIAAKRELVNNFATATSWMFAKTSSKILRPPIQGRNTNQILRYSFVNPSWKISSVIMGRPFSSQRFIKPKEKSSTMFF